MPAETAETGMQPRGHVDSRQLSSNNRLFTNQDISERNRLRGSLMYSFFSKK